MNIYGSGHGPSAVVYYALRNFSVIFEGQTDGPTNRQTDLGIKGPSRRLTNQANNCQAQPQPQLQLSLAEWHNLCFIQPPIHRNIVLAL